MLTARYALTRISWERDRLRRSCGTADMTGMAGVILGGDYDAARPAGGTERQSAGCPVRLHS